MEPVVVLEQSVSTATLGQAVLQALDASHHHAPWPTDWKAVLAPLLKVAGVKSDRAFMKACKSASVNLEHGVVTVITSTTKQYPGAASMTGQFKVPLSDAQALGAEVIKGLELSD